jgi:murein DD-endopeptidase MepM/ murein hydrolase activator NlpD
MSRPAKRIDHYLSRQRSPLAGLGPVFVAAGDHYKVDPNLLVAIAGAETGFGTTGGDIAAHNAWGYGPHIKFQSWPDAIDTIARDLRTNYLDKGLTTIPQIQSRWAPAGAANDPTGLNSNWTRNVTRFYNELTGQPSTGAPVPSPGLTAPAAAPAATRPPVSAPAPLASPTSLLDPVLGAVLQSNQQRLGLPSLNPALLSLLATPVAPPAPAPAAAAPQPSTPNSPAVTGGTSVPTPQAGAPGASTRFKLIGVPYQGTHAKAFNVRGGSDNWESENAVDVAVPIGTPIRAVASGTIGTRFGSLGSGGRFAGLRLHLQTDGNDFYYAHLSKFAPGIKPGTRVQAGQIIGYSGEANGVAHLHLATATGTPESIYQQAI